MNKTNSFTTLKTFLDEQLQHGSNHHITVFPLRCGIGKSTYIRYTISDTLQNGRSGLIVITDAIDRLHEYVNADYLEINRDRIALLTSDTVRDELKTQWRKPILIMTTQRYFALSREEIIAFTKYEGGNRRDKIIFDEKPYLIERHKVRIKTFNDIDTALHESIDDTIDPDEKAWITTQWKILIERMKEIMVAYESMTENQLEKWHYTPNSTLTEDDSRFFAFIERHKQKLNQSNNGVYVDIQAIRQLVYEGATIICHKMASGEYEKYFVVTWDNSEKLLNLGADVYVLDGTADIDPEYQVHYVKMVDCTDFLVPLKNLTINIVDAPATSKTRLCKDESASRNTISALKRYMETDAERVSAIFTCQKIVNQFESILPADGLTGHFGAIKGSNRYRNMTHIAQVGLNRYSDTEYRQIAYLTKLLGEDYGASRVERVIGQPAIDKVMNLSLLADFEQNLFRSKLRNIDCVDNVVYTLFINVSAYQGLIDLITERYGKRLGATIKIINRPAELDIAKAQNRKANKKTYAQLVIDWINLQPSGSRFTTSQLREACQLTREQWKNAKKSVGVDRLLSKMRDTTPDEFVVP